MSRVTVQHQPKKTKKKIKAPQRNLQEGPLTGHFWSGNENKIYNLLCAKDSGRKLSPGAVALEIGAN